MFSLGEFPEHHGGFGVSLSDDVVYKTGMRVRLQMSRGRLFMGLLLAVTIQCFGCGERVLEPVVAAGDTATGNFDTETSTISSDDFDTDSMDTTGDDTERVYIAVTHDGGADISIMVTPIGDEELQTSWYGFQDDQAQMTVTVVDGRTICAEGTIQGGAGDLGYAGIGLSLCFTDGSDIPPYTLIPIGSCPFTTDMATRFSGVAFDFDGTAAGAALQLHFREQDDNTPAYFPLNNPGEAEYLFADALLMTEDDVFTVENVISIQFQAQTIDESPQAFNFCVSNFALLLQ